MSMQGNDAALSGLRIRALFAAALAVIGFGIAMVIAPMSAQAHELCVTHPSDPSMVCVRARFPGTHNAVWVYDKQADGHRVYARAVIDEGSIDYHYAITGYDYNDSAAGGSMYDTFEAYESGDGYPHPFETVPFAVCVQNEGCSLWRAHDGSLISGSYTALTYVTIPRISP